MMTDEQKLNALKEYKKYRAEYIRVYTEAKKAGNLHDRSVQENLQFLNGRGMELMNSTL